jgi:tetratricopeptide (TPR) repeat protein
MRLKKYDQGIADLRQAIACDPNNALACNNLAWFYVTGPENRRDARAALPLARKAVEAAPGQWTCLNTLGVVYYRLGEYRQALDTLEWSLREGSETTAGFDWLFLAMSHWRLGEQADARHCYDRAVQWVREHPQLSPDWSEELASFRAEAEELMRKPR